MKKVLIIYHKVDIDGWMSAAIAKLWYEKDKSDITLLGYNYGEEIRADLFKYDIVEMVDVSLDIDTMKKLANHYGKNFIYIDHHSAKVIEVLNAVNKDNISGKTNTSTNLSEAEAACELAWKYHYPDMEMPMIVYYAGAYDCFRHTTFDILQSDSVLYVQYGMRLYIKNIDMAYDYLRKEIYSNVSYIDDFFRDGSSIVKYLKSEAQSLMKNRSFIVKLEDINGKKYTFLAINRDRLNPMNFDIKQTYDGFLAFSYHGQMKKWLCSIYSSTVDCALIAKKYGGGGHKGASGFIINDIKEFIPA